MDQDRCSYSPGGSPHRERTHSRMGIGGVGSMTCDCYCIPTPDSILEDDEIDVFEQIIPNSEQFYALKREALWNFYALRGIGNCDMAYWIKAMQYRYGQIKTKYNVKFKVIEEWLTEVSGNDPVDLSDSSSEYKMTTENEDTPDNPQGNTVYLSDRNTVTYNGKSYGGLSSETVRQFIDAVPDIEKEFADEFRLQFYHGV